MAEARIKDVEAQSGQGGQGGQGNDKPARSGARDTEALAQQMDTLRSDLASITELLGEIGVRRKDETVAAARERFDRARHEGEARWNDAQAKVHETQDELLQAIRRQPGTAIGIAVAAGFLAGILTSRR